MSNEHEKSLKKRWLYLTNIMNRCKFHSHNGCDGLSPWSAQVPAKIFGELFTSFINKGSGTM